MVYCYIWQWVILVTHCEISNVSMQDLKLLEKSLINLRYKAKSHYIAKYSFRMLQYNVSANYSCLFLVILKVKVILTRNAHFK